MADYLKSEIGDVKKKGFGIIPKLVMQDERLSIEAKAIYAYMASFAGAGDTAFPGVEKMLKDFGIGSNRFYKHRKLLIDLGYITVTKTRKDGKRDNNIYTLNQIVIEKQHLQNEGIENEEVEIQHLHFEEIENQRIEIQCIENEGTNNNSLLKTTVLNNNSIKKQQLQKKKKESCGSSSEKEKNSKMDQDTDKDFGELAKLYQECIGQPNGLTVNWINEMLDQYGFEWCKNAMLIAEEQGKRSKSYVRGILENWKTKGGMKLEKEDKPKSSNISTKPIKTKFHNFNGRTGNYTPEELEKIVLNKHKNKDIPKLVER